MQKATAGEYVQVYEIILAPGERAPQVPDDTQQVPLEMRVKGFLNESATIKDVVSITTVTGREVRGILEKINPIFEHDFGAPIPELLTVGSELRNLLNKGSDNDE